jgi:hypothetical protein
MSVIQINAGANVVAEYVNHDTKVVAVTRRNPELSGCKVIDNHGVKFLNWAWLCVNAPNKPWLNNWNIIAFRVDTKSGNRIKENRIQYWRDLGYQVRYVKNFV